MCKLIMIHGITDYSVTLTGQGGFLTLYAPITTAADNILIFFFFFKENVLTFHVNHLPSLKKKEKKKK